MANIIKVGTAVEDTAVQLYSGSFYGSVSGNIVSRDLSEFKYIVISYTNNYWYGQQNYWCCKVPTSGSWSTTLIGKVFTGGYDGRSMWRTVTVTPSSVSAGTTANAPDGDGAYPMLVINAVWGIREGGMF